MLYSKDKTKEEKPKTAPPVPKTKTTSEQFEEIRKPK